MSAPDAEYQPVDAGAEGPNGADTTQDDYKSRTGQSTIPVVSDSTNIEDPIDANTADSDAQLGEQSTPTVLVASHADKACSSRRF